MVRNGDRQVRSKKVGRDSFDLVGGTSSIQGQRRPNNEDCSYFSPVARLLVVADGMGGHAAGEVASQLTIEHFFRTLGGIPRDSSANEVATRIRAGLSRAQAGVRRLTEQDSALCGAGSTVVAAVLLQNTLYYASVGDSRAYLIRNHRIRCLTVDDTWPNFLVQLGELSDEQIADHPMRNVLTSAIGMKDFKPEEVEVKSVKIMDGDRLLLTTDGLCDVVNDERILEILASSQSPRTAAARLTEETVSANGGDDVTCLVADCYSYTNKLRNKRFMIRLLDQVFAS